MLLAFRVATIRLANSEGRPTLPAIAEPAGGWSRLRTRDCPPAPTPPQPNNKNRSGWPLRARQKDTSYHSSLLVFSKRWRFPFAPIRNLQNFVISRSVRNAPETRYRCFTSGLVSQNPEPRRPLT